MENNVVIKIALDNIEQSASQPQLKKMLSENWRVIASIPVDDNGIPTLIMVLAPPQENIKVIFPFFPMLTDVMVMILLFSIFMAILFGNADV